MWHWGEGPAGGREGVFPPAPRAGLPLEDGAAGIPSLAGSDSPHTPSAQKAPLALHPPGLLEVWEVG